MTINTAWSLLAPHARTRNLQAKDALFHGDEPVSTLFYVAVGCVKLLKVLPDGRQQILRFYGPGDFLGLVGGTYRDCIAEVVGHSTVVQAISHAAIRMQAQRTPAINAWMFDLLSAELGHFQDSVLVAQMTAEEKLQYFFASYAPQQTGDVLLPMQQSDIAEYLAMAPETVSRKIQAFRKQGVIQRDGYRMTLHRAAAPSDFRMAA